MLRPCRCTVGVNGKWPLYTAQLLQLIETATDNVSGLRIHAEFTVDDHAKVTDFVQRRIQMTFH